ncbi:hypothetical protein [Humidesulfovibrio sp.]
MSGITLKKIIKSRPYKVFLGCMLALGIVVSLAGALLLALPGVVSSDWARGQVAGQLTKSTGMPASIDTLTFSWGEGLRLQGLRVGTGELADASFLASLQALHADLGYRPLLRGELHLTLELQGLRLRVPHNPTSEPKPPAPPLPQALRSAFASLRNGLAPQPFNADAHLRVDMSDMDLRLETGPGGKALELHRISFFVESKGLAAAPVHIKAGLNIAADDAPPIPMRFAASITGLKDASGRLNPAQASLDASLDGPGLELIATGSLAQTLTISVQATPGKFLSALRPLAPGNLPELDGSLGLDLSLAQRAPHSLDASLSLSATALRAHGGSLGNASAGPFTLAVRQGAVLDLAAETANLPGSLLIAPGSHAQWLAALEGVAQGKLRLSLNITDTRLDLGGLAPALRAFLPAGIGIGQAELVLANCDVNASLPATQKNPEISAKPEINAKLIGLALRADRLSKGDASGKKANRLSLGRLDLQLEEASLALPAEGNGRAEASLSSSLADLRQTGATPVSVRQFSLPKLFLRAESLRLDPASLYGVAAQIALELNATSTGIEAKGKAAIPALTASTRLRAQLPGAKSASASLEALNVDAPVVRLPQPGKKPLEAPLTLRASAESIQLAEAGATPALRGLQLALDIGPALHCEAQASLDGPTGRELRSQGSLRLDAAHTLALASAFAPRQTKASGGVSLDWRVAATLPPPDQTSAPTATPNSAPARTSAPASVETKAAPAPKNFKQKLKDLAGLRELETVLRLDALSLDWPLAEPESQNATGQKPAANTTEILRLRGVSTPKPLRLNVTNGAQDARLAGSVAFGPLDSLPGVGKLDKPLRGLLTLNAAQQGARSVQLSQMLRLEGLNTDQNLTLTLDKLDAVLERDKDRLAAALELLDGSFSFSLGTGLDALPSGAAAKGLSGSGRLAASAEGRLSGGRSLALSARVSSPGLDLRLGPDLGVSGLTSSLHFARRYRLTRGLQCPIAGEASPLPLSEQVFDLFPTQSQTPSNGGEALGQLLRTDSTRATAGALGFARLKRNSGGTSLDIRDFEARLDDSGPVPGLRSFRAGVLGGNILGSAHINKSAGSYSLDADLAFTGIDPGRLLPDKTPRDQGEQAEAAGRITLSLPITPDPEQLLRRLSLRADLTKIGPRTLERILYALDPQEQNETIVQQRRLMGIGYPRNLRVAAAYGNLSLSGAVEVKGFRLDLPPVDRLGVANLPIKHQLAKPLAAVPGLIKLLDAASGSLICRDPADAPGTLRVVEPASQGAFR